MKILAMKINKYRGQNATLHFRPLFLIGPTKEMTLIYKTNRHIKIVVYIMKGPQKHNPSDRGRPYKTTFQLNHTFYSTVIRVPSDTRLWPNVVLLPVQRRRRWANIKTALCKRIAFAGVVLLYFISRDNDSINWLLYENRTF